MNKPTKTKIDWPGLDYTWNPVCGCERMCSWCVVRNRVWPRIKHIYGDHDFTKVTFHPEQLQKPLMVKEPSKWFVGFYSDPEYWKPLWWYGILDIVSRCPQHTFMFLSKNPHAYNEINKKGYWHKNCMQGLTLTCEQVIVELQEHLIWAMKECPRPFLSLEPILGTLKTDAKFFEQVICGTQTGAGAKPPEPEWIESVKRHTEPSKLHWKKNIRSYL